MSKFVLTITGADEEVDPMELIALSEKYEFVEWGILFSATEPGKNRYPTKEWRSAFYDSIMSTTAKVNTSAHLCGSFVDQRLYSRDYLTTEVEMFYRRVQFNKFNEDNSKHVLDYAASTSTPTIIPLNKKTAQIVDFIENKSRLSFLHDSSGGNGKAPDVWPEHVKGSFITGYAGGITEENVVDVITKLGARPEYKTDPFWIDLETGARGLDNKFSLPQVERILEKASAFYGENRIQLLS